MRLPRLYTPQALALHAECDLDDNAAQHLVKVLRFKAGASVVLFNGDGHHYTAELIATGKRSARVRINGQDASTAESPLQTHIGQAISRGDRMDYAIQKATELGVHHITPLFTERCEVRLNAERQAKRREHWQQVAISAAEQCGRATIPHIHECQPLDIWLAQKHADELALVLHHRDTTPEALHKMTRPEAVRLLIGPEGGLSAEEISRAADHDFYAATFGPRVWRTETAPVAVLSIIQWLWGDLGR